jgi:hypothetical protein
MPVLQNLLRQLPGQGVRVKRGLHRLEHAPYLGFPVSAACASYLTLPLDPWKQGLPGPCPPGCRDGGLLQSLLDAFPPKIHESCQGRQLVPHFLHGIVACWQLLPLGERFDSVDCRL